MKWRPGKFFHAKSAESVNFIHQNVKYFDTIGLVLVRFWYLYLKTVRKSIENVKLLLNCVIIVVNMLIDSIFATNC